MSNMEANMKGIKEDTNYIRGDGAQMKEGIEKFGHRFTQLEQSITRVKKSNKVNPGEPTPDELY